MSELETVAEGGTLPEHSSSSRKHSETRGLHQSVSNYKFGKTIGKGNFAKVKLARHILTDVEVAVKIIDKTNLTEANLAKLSREVRIMKMLNHPNIVKLYEVIETERTLYLVMEFADGGEVFDYLVAHGRMKEKEARARFREILSAVQYCHSKNIIHRDLKAENLLLDAEMRMKIADFGFSNMYTPGTQLDTFCGSPPYAAPELFQGKKYDGPEVDVWSLGVILYTLVSGSLPFDGTNLKELRERVLKGRYRIPFYMSTECEQFLKMFLVLNPAKRATLDAVMSHPWVNIGYDDNPLLPYQDPLDDFGDEVRLATMEKWGFSRAEVLASLTAHTFDHRTATYLLLARMKQATLHVHTAPRLIRPQSSATLPVSTLRDEAANKRSQRPPMDPVPAENVAMKIQGRTSQPSPRASPRTANRSLPQPLPTQPQTSSPRHPAPISVLDSPSTTLPPHHVSQPVPTEPLSPSNQLTLPEENSLKMANTAHPTASPTNSSHPNTRKALAASLLQQQSEQQQLQQQASLPAQGNQSAPDGNMPRMGRRHSSVLPPLHPSDSSALPVTQEHPRKVQPFEFDRSKSSTVREPRRRTLTETEIEPSSPSSSVVDDDVASSSSPPKGFFATLRRLSRRGSNASDKSSSTKPRSLRFTFGMTNTSSKPAEDILEDIKHVLRNNAIEFAQTEPFLLTCKHGTINFEMEVCKLPRLSMNGVRHKRIGGDSLGYKNICTKILNELNL